MKIETKDEDFDDNIVINIPIDKDLMHEEHS
jgi:hypothetical protein